MTKSKQDKLRPTKARPDQLSQLGRRSGVELSESELGQASGGDVYRTFKLVDIPRLAT